MSPGISGGRSSGWCSVRILALETTERVGSVAALDDGNLLCELGLDPKKRSAQSLAPGLKELLERVGWRPTDVDLVAVPVGPGSFTGLRVGITAAKSFAYAASADILGVETLEVIAAGAPAGIDAVVAALDAQRGEVVAQPFERGEDGLLRSAGSASLVEIDAWLQSLAPGAFLTGPVLEKITDRVPDHLTVLDPKYWAPSAAWVGRVAFRRYSAGERDDVWRLAPRYSRRSAAEEKWEQRKAP
jgi:tRNA threonylcarbamoyladenosine biosynthesis protein TsaB